MIDLYLWAIENEKVTGSVSSCCLRWMHLYFTDRTMGKRYMHDWIKFHLHLKRSHSADETGIDPARNK